MYLIIVGCGRMGSNLAYELSDLGHDICIIDRNKDRLSVLGSGFNGQIINGIEFDRDNLSAAGIESADALLAVTPDDNINITVSMIANKIYHLPRVIARVNDPKRKYIYEQLKIETINPVQLGAELLTNRLHAKNCNIISELEDGYEVIEFEVRRDVPVASIEKIENKYSCNISLIKGQEGYIFPQKDGQLHSGDKVLCTIHKDDKDALLKLVSKEMQVWMPSL
ncbi:MAG: TrkA family potassium uptake protein [Oscillospiraceae bacterium]